MEPYIFEAEDISVKIGQHEIISQCSLSARAGEFIGIIGPNGSGKSTFLKAVRNLVKRETGAVRFFSREESSMGEKEIARICAFMPQEFHVPFGYTCREIVMAARYPYLKWWQKENRRDKEKVERAMQFTGVLHLADKPIQVVSGGEKQRVLLAKILAQETPVIFLDEPTAALDLLYQEEIFRLCRHLASQGRTVVMICHDLTMAAKWCSRLVLLSRGRIRCEGSPQSVLTEKNLKDFFGLDSIVYTDRVSGDLSIYTYLPKEKPESADSILVLGYGLETCTLIRLLYTSGFRFSCGYLPPFSLAREAASDFHIPFLQSPAETASVLDSHSLILAYGLSSEEENFLKGKKVTAKIYSDLILVNSLPTPFSSVAKAIEEGTL